MNTIHKYLICLCLALWASALSAQTHFSFDYRQFQYDMTVFFMPVDVQGNPVGNPENYEVAAFVGDECRGVGTMLTETLADEQTLTYGYMRVYSNSDNGETVSFRYYKKDSSEEGTVAGTTLAFVSNKVTGLPSSPFTLTIKDKILGDVNGNGRVDMGDAATIFNFLMGRLSSIDESVADTNRNGRVDMGDAATVFNYLMGRLADL